jgi:hypothetical protein
VGCAKRYAKGDALASFQWAREAVTNNPFTGWESLLRRLWFFPLSWMIGVGPPVAYLIIKYIFKSYKKDQRGKFIINWSIPFWILFLIIIYNCFEGSLLMQHRFSGTLVIFSLPFISFYFNEITARKIRLAIIFGMLTFGLAFVYNTDGVKPVPRLRDQSIQAVSNTINKNLEKESCLILDFVGWDYTYFIALQSQLNPKDIVILPDNYFSGADIEKAVNDHANGIVLIKKDSPFQKETIYQENKLSFTFYSDILAAKKILDNEKFIVLYWNKL